MVTFFITRTKTAGIFRIHGFSADPGIPPSLVRPGIPGIRGIALLGLQAVLEGSAQCGAILGAGLLPALLQGPAFFATQLGHPLLGWSKDAVQLMGGCRQGQKGEQQGEKSGAVHVESPLVDLHHRESR